MEFQNKIIQTTAELQSCKDNNQRLLEEKKELQTKIDLTNAELQSARSENQRLLEEKIKVLDDREVYRTQLLFIEKWSACMDELENHVRAMLHCSESKRGRSLHADARLCSKISYDLDERYAVEAMLRAVDLIMKYKVEYRKFLDALLLKKVEEMKKLQADYDMKKLKKQWKK